MTVHGTIDPDEMGTTLPHEHVLHSHDARWYHVGEPGGENFRPYDTLFTEFIPALRNEGFAELELRQLLVENPREAFTIRVRST